MARLPDRADTCRLPSAPAPLASPRSTTAVGSRRPRGRPPRWYPGAPNRFLAHSAPLSGHRWPFTAATTSTPSTSAAAPTRRPASNTLRSHVVVGRYANSRQYQHCCHYRHCNQIRVNHHRKPLANIVGLRIRIPAGNSPARRLFAPFCSASIPGRAAARRLRCSVRRRAPRHVQRAFDPRLPGSLRSCTSRRSSATSPRSALISRPCAAISFRRLVPSVLDFASQARALRLDLAALCGDYLALCGDLVPQARAQCLDLAAQARTLRTDRRQDHRQQSRHHSDRPEQRGQFRAHRPVNQRTGRASTPVKLRARAAGGRHPCHITSHRPTGCAPSGSRRGRPPLLHVHLAQ